MYNKGDLKIITPQCEEAKEDEFGCYIDNHYHDAISDSREDYKYFDVGSVFLPHSCDEWIIGNKENIELLIEDLKEVLKNL